MFTIIDSLISEQSLPIKEQNAIDSRFQFLLNFLNGLSESDSVVCKEIKHQKILSFLQESFPISPLEKLKILFLTNTSFLKSFCVCCYISLLIFIDYRLYFNIFFVYTIVEQYKNFLMFFILCLFFILVLKNREKKSKLSFLWSKLNVPDFEKLWLYDEARKEKKRSFANSGTKTFLIDEKNLLIPSKASYYKFFLYVKQNIDFKIFLKDRPDLMAPYIQLWFIDNYSNSLFKQINLFFMFDDSFLGLFFLIGVFNLYFICFRILVEMSLF